MGGVGSGGGRTHAGRKPLDANLASVRGSRDRGTRPSTDVLAAAVADLPVVDAPADLTEAQAAVWAELAPHALRLLTLTPETAMAFRDLCEAVVERRGMAATIAADGRTYQKTTVDGAGQEHTELKAHPLITHERGMRQRVEAGMARFRLTADGKPRLPGEAPKAKSALEQLQEQGSKMRVVRGGKR